MDNCDWQASKGHKKNTIELIVMKNTFTIDVEDGINIAMRDHFQVEMPPTDRVVKNTSRILDLLAKHDTKATFFTLGQVAEHYPNLLKRIDAEGHEVGVHSYNHIQFFKLNPEAAREDLYRAKNTIEGIIGRKAKGFRAPAFSVRPDTKWALDIISELGFEYDSSIVPARTDRYGWPGFSKNIQLLKLLSGRELIEVPLSSVDILGRSVPAGGGGYLRIFPYWFTKWALKRIQQNNFAMVYLHPYEIDTSTYPDQYYEQMKKSPLKKQLLLKSIRYNKETVYPKLEKLLKAFSFNRLDENIQHALKENSVLVTKIL